VPFCRAQYGSAKYTSQPSRRSIVRQFGIFKPHGVQAICSGDQVALSFSFMYSIVACDRNIPLFFFLLHLIV